MRWQDGRATHEEAGTAFKEAGALFEETGVSLEDDNGGADKVDGAGGAVDEARGADEAAGASLSIRVFSWRLRKVVFDLLDTSVSAQAFSWRYTYASGHQASFSLVLTLPFAKKMIKND